MKTDYHNRTQCELRAQAQTNRPDLLHYSSLFGIGITTSGTEALTRGKWKCHGVGFSDHRLPESGRDTGMDRCLLTGDQLGQSQHAQIIHNISD